MFVTNFLPSNQQKTLIKKLNEYFGRSKSEKKKSFLFFLFFSGELQNKFVSNFTLKLIQKRFLSKHQIIRKDDFIATSIKILWVNNSLKATRFFFRKMSTQTSLYFLWLRGGTLRI